MMTENKIISFYKLFKKKEFFDLIISKISSDGGDFLRIIEIALCFYLISSKTAGY